MQVSKMLDGRFLAQRSGAKKRDISVNLDSSCQIFALCCQCKYSIRDIKLILVFTPQKSNSYKIRSRLSYLILGIAPEISC